MLSDLESRLINRRPGRLNRVVRVGGVYLLIALALMAELLLVALHPEDDPVLLIGIILLTIAVSLWLRFLFLVPVVILLWLLPPSVRDAALRDEPFTWSHAAVLASQLYLAGATRLAYRALRTRLLTGDATATRPAADEAAAPSQPPEPPSIGLDSARPPLPCGRVLAPEEAATLLDRLIGLDRELRLSGETIRAMLENGLTSGEQPRQPVGR